jgi:hypothetical protein
MIVKHRNPTGTVFGVEYQNPGVAEPYKFDHTLKGLENKVIKNIFTEDQVLAIKDSISKSKKGFVNPNRAQAYTISWELPDDVRKKIENLAFDTTGEEWLIADFAFCRYQNKTIDGKEWKPELKMHRDENFQSQRLCLDYQLESNTSWDMIVVDSLFPMEDNSALLFSSTDQFHGRPKKKFLDGEFIDLIFFHLSKDGTSHDAERTDIVVVD